MLLQGGHQVRHRLARALRHGGRACSAAVAPAEADACAEHGRGVVHHISSGVVRAQQRRRRTHCALGLGVRGVGTGVVVVVAFEARVQQGRACVREARIAVAACAQRRNHRAGKLGRCRQAGSRLDSSPPA